MHIKRNQERALCVVWWRQWVHTPNMCQLSKETCIHIYVRRDSQKRPIYVKKDLKRALCVMWWASACVKNAMNHQRRPVWQIHQKRPTKEAYKDQKRPDQDVASVIMSVRAPNMWKSSKETYIPMYVKKNLQKRPIIIKRDLYTSKKIWRGRGAWLDGVSTWAKCL